MGRLSGCWSPCTDHRNPHAPRKRWAALQFGYSVAWVMSAAWLVPWDRCCSLEILVHNGNGHTAQAISSLPTVTPAVSSPARPATNARTAEGGSHPSPKAPNIRDSVIHSAPWKVPVRSMVLGVSVLPGEPLLGIPGPSTSGSQGLGLKVRSSSKGEAP